MEAELNTQSTTHTHTSMHTQTHRHLERSIESKRTFNCSLFLKPLHKHSFVWRVTSAVHWADSCSKCIWYFYMQLKKKIKYREKSVMLGATWASWFWAGEALRCAINRNTAQPTSQDCVRFSEPSNAVRAESHLVFLFFLNQIHKGELVCIFRFI